MGLVVDPNSPFYKKDDPFGDAVEFLRTEPDRDTHLQTTCLLVQNFKLGRDSHESCSSDLWANLYKALWVSRQLGTYRKSVQLLTRLRELDEL